MKKNVNFKLIKRNDENIIIMSYLTSKDISLANHKSNETSTLAVINLPILKGVSLGALISFEDGNNINRKKQKIPGEEIYQIVFQQLCIFQSYAAEYNLSIHYIELKGQLSELAYNEPYIAFCIAKSVLDFDDKIFICGSNDSQLFKQANALHLKTILKL